MRILKAYHATVAVSANASRYTAFASPEAYGFFIANDPLTGQVRHSTLAEEFLRLGQGGSGV